MKISMVVLGLHVNRCTDTQTDIVKLSGAEFQLLATDTPKNESYKKCPKLMVILMY